MEAFSKSSSTTSSEKQERGFESSPSIQVEQAGGSRPEGRGKEGRAVVAEASTQKGDSCGQEEGRERQGQAERQRQYQVELGQIQDSLGLLCRYHLSRPSLNFQSNGQHNVLPLPTPFDLVLLMRAPCPTASALSDEAICCLGLTTAFEASSVCGTSVSSEIEAIQHSVSKLGQA